MSLFKVFWNITVDYSSNNLKCKQCQNKIEKYKLKYWPVKYDNKEESKKIKWKENL